MKKLVNLLAIAVLFSATSFAQTGSLEEVLNWLETECAEDTTGLAEYCDLLELAIACEQGDSIACFELEVGIQDLLDNGDEDGQGDDLDDLDDVTEWLNWLEAECAENPDSEACAIIATATACLGGDSLACEELELLIDGFDWDDDEDGDDDDDEDGDDDDDEDGDDDDDEDGDDDDDEDGDDDNGGDDNGGDDTGAVTGCNAVFDVVQAMTADSMPIAGSVWVYIYDYSDALTYSWDFGDEGTSSDPFPTWTYSTDGPYTICLTVSDTLGTCSDTYCASISVDSLGNVGGFMNGFTITVLDGGQGSGTPASVIEQTPALDEMVIYPNPNAQAFVRIRWNALANGTATATLFDLRGAIAEEVQTNAWAGENQLELNIADLERGYYLVQLTMGATRVTQRLIIQ